MPVTPRSLRRRAAARPAATAVFAASVGMAAAAFALMQTWHVHPNNYAKGGNLTVDATTTSSSSAPTSASSNEVAAPLPTLPPAPQFPLVDVGRAPSVDSGLIAVVLADTGVPTPPPPPSPPPLTLPLPDPGTITVPVDPSNLPGIDQIAGPKIPVSTDPACQAADSTLTAADDPAAAATDGSTDTATTATLVSSSCQDPASIVSPGSGATAASGSSPAPASGLSAVG